MKGLKMVSLDVVQNEILLTDKSVKSSGAPLFTSKKEALSSGDLGRAKAISTGRVAPPPAVAYYRTQVSKTRLVWCLPLSMILVEGTYMVPIMEKIRCVKTPYTMGMTSAGIVGRMDKLSYSPVQYCLDWSKFDSTVPLKVLAACFSIIKSWFDSVDDTTFSLVQRYFCTCPLLMPDGYIYTGRRRGVPSGSWFTQLIDSLANMFLSNYIATINKDTILDGLYLGDDSVLAMPGMPNVKSWAEQAKKIGMMINPEKQEITHGKPHFLGHYWGEVAPGRPIDETVQRLATSERFKAFGSRAEYREYEFQRALALLVDNYESYDLIVEYLAYLLKVPAYFVYLQLTNGQIMTGTSVRTSWALAQSQMQPYNRAPDGRPVHLSHQILRH